MLKKIISASALLLAMSSAYAREGLVENQSNGKQTVLIALLQDPLATNLDPDTTVFKDLAQFEGDETSCKFFQAPIASYVCVEANTVYTEGHLIDQYSECSLKNPGKCQPKDFLPQPKGIDGWFRCLRDSGLAKLATEGCVAILASPAPILGVGACPAAAATIETARQVCGGS